MTILGIETSCDETAAAIVENGTRLISNVVASSQFMHAKYGGIIPDKAAREQLKSIIPVIHETLRISEHSEDSVHQETRQSETLKSRYSGIPSVPSVPNIDAIAVTVGPGLIGSLLVGVETAKVLALAWNKPIVPINHLIGHIYANWLVLPQSPTTNDLSHHYQPSTNHSRVPQFPALVLLVSGGHTELILMTDHVKFKLLGSTLDDAAGECFDKCARLLNLGYPGGPAIEATASKFQISNFKFQIKLPRPMLHDKNFDFSFSGLKTAVLNISRTQNLEPSHLAYELQEAVTDVLIAKTLAAAERFRPKSILLAGGVAANLKLREKIKFQISSAGLADQIELYVPDIKLCTDNAAYIASAAYFNYKPVPWEKITADPSLDFQ